MSPSQNILPVAQLHFRALQGVAPEDVVLLAVIPGYPDPGEVELSKEIWSTMSTVVHTVSFDLDSGAYIQLSLGREPREDAAADIDRKDHFLVASIQKCDPRTSAARRFCLIIRRHPLNLTLEDFLVPYRRLYLLQLRAHR